MDDNAKPSERLKFHLEKRDESNAAKSVKTLKTRKSYSIAELEDELDINLQNDFLEKKEMNFRLKMNELKFRPTPKPLNENENNFNKPKMNNPIKKNWRNYCPTSNIIHFFNFFLLKEDDVPKPIEPTVEPTVELTQELTQKPIIEIEPEILQSNISILPKGIQFIYTNFNHRIIY